jgi:hypothetical protein
MRPSFTIVTPAFGKSRTGARKPVAAMTSSLSSSSSPGNVVPLARMRYPLAWRSTRSMAASTT